MIERRANSEERVTSSEPAALLSHSVVVLSQPLQVSSHRDAVRGDFYCAVALDVQQPKVAFEVRAQFDVAQNILIPDTRSGSIPSVTISAMPALAPLEANSLSSSERL